MMENIKPDAMRILAEICMDENDGDVVQSFKDIKLIDDLLRIIKAKSLINHTKGRRPNKEKRFNEIFEARIYQHAKEKLSILSDYKIE